MGLADRRSVSRHLARIADLGVSLDYRQPTSSDRYERLDRRFAVHLDETAFRTLVVMCWRGGEARVLYSDPLGGRDDEHPGLARLIGRGVTAVKDAQRRLVALRALSPQPSAPGSPRAWRVHPERALVPCAHCGAAPFVACAHEPVAAGQFGLRDVQGWACEQLGDVDVDVAARFEALVSRSPTSANCTVL